MSNRIDLFKPAQESEPEPQSCSIGCSCNSKVAKELEQQGLPPELAEVIAEKMGPEMEVFGAIKEQVDKQYESVRFEKPAMRIVVGAKRLNGTLKVCGFLTAGTDQSHPFSFNFSAN